MAILKEATVRKATYPDGTGARFAKKYIFSANTGDLAALYDDRNLTNSMANPLTSDEAGNFNAFYLNEGRYNVEIIDANGGILTKAANVPADFIAVNPNAQQFKSVEMLLADTLLAYTPYSGQIEATPGDFIYVSDGGFTYQIAPEDVDNNHLETAGGLKVCCVPNSVGELTVRQFGAVEGGDIYEALQTAVIAASNWSGAGATNQPLGCGVFIDVQEATLSDTIHMLYGYSPSGAQQFRGVNVRGYGRKYAAGAGHMGTRIVFTATDRPAFVVQNGRNTRMCGFSLHGALRPALLEVDYDTMTTRSEEGWDTLVASAGITPNRRYAPYAGIAIDPYSGPEPDDAYPPITTNHWQTSANVYGNTGGSSHTTIEDMAIEGFEVGIVQQPGDASANSDYAVFKNVDFRYCKFADSIGSSQSRNTTRLNCSYLAVWCIVTNHKHGQRIGTSAGSLTNCSGAGFIGRLFDLNGLSYGGGLVFNEMDVENLWQIGWVGGPSTTETELLMKMCQINFSHGRTQIFPGQVIEGTTNGTIRLESCKLKGYGSVCSAPNIPGIKAVGTTFLPDEARSKDYQKMGHNLLSGGFVPNLLGGKPQEVRFVPHTIGGGTVNSQVLSPSYHYTSRNYCIPLSAGQTTYFDRYLQRLRMESRRGDYNTRKIGNHFSITDVSERSVTIDMSSQFNNEQNVLQRGYLPGDIAVHEPTGTVMFVRSTDDTGTAGSTYSGGSGAITLEMQNNYVLDGGTYQPIDPSFLDNDEKWVFVCGRVYAPAVPIKGEIATDSNAISVVAPSGAISPDYGLSAGDCYWEDQDYYQTFSSTGRAIVSSIDTSSGQIVMGGNANQSLPDHVFGFWCRQPPANEATR